MTVMKDVAAPWLDADVVVAKADRFRVSDTLGRDITSLMKCDTHLCQNRD